MPAGGGTGGLGGFLLTVGAVFGYTAGWTPYAADYTRYLPATVSRWATGLAAGVGNALACTVLMIVGAASVSAAAGAGITSDNPTTAYVGVLPGWLAALTLIAIAIGAVSANILNIYSGRDGVPLHGDPGAHARARAYVALAFGVVGFVIALLALGDAATGYENFLLVIVYWIGPWLGVMFADQWLRRDRIPHELLYDRTYTNPAGVVAMVVGIVVSVVLFSNQTLFTGLVPRAVPEIGDITFFVGIVLAAALVRGAGAPQDRRVNQLLDTALAEARAGLAEGGIPIGAALFAADGELLGRGHNRRVQDGDPSMHAETAAFRQRRAAARLPQDDHGDDAVAVLVLLGAGAAVRDRCRAWSGEARTFYGGHDWLAEHGVRITVLDDERCVALMDGLHRRAARAVERGHRGANVIPTVDLRRTPDAAAVDEAMQKAGFLLVTGHGVDPALRAELRAAARRFFALPDVGQAAVRRGDRRAGLASPGVESNGNADVFGGGEAAEFPPDLKESFAIGPDTPTGDPAVDAVWFPPNVWPSEVP